MAKIRRQAIGVIGADRRSAAGRGGLSAFLSKPKRHRAPWQPSTALTLPTLDVPWTLREADRGGHAEALRVCQVLDAAFPNAAFQPADSPEDWIKENLKFILPNSGTKLRYGLELSGIESGWGKSKEAEGAICQFFFRSKSISEDLVRLVIGPQIIRLERELENAGKAFYDRFISLMNYGLGLCNPKAAFQGASGYHWYDAETDEEYLARFASEYASEELTLPLSSEMQTIYDNQYKPSDFIKSLRLPDDGRDWSWAYKTHADIEAKIPRRAKAIYDEMGRLCESKPQIYNLTDSSHAHSTSRYLSEFVVEWSQQDDTTRVYDEMANLEFQAGECDPELICAGFADEKKLIEVIKQAAHFVNWTREVVAVVEQIRRMPS